MAQQTPCKGFFTLLDNMEAKTRPIVLSSI